MTQFKKEAGEREIPLNIPKRPIPPKYVDRARNCSKTKVKKLLDGTIAGRVTDTRGYARIKMGCHPRRDSITGYVYEHIVAAEMCLGRRLARGELVHHADGNLSNSHYSNLFVFPDQRAHARYHWAVRKGMEEGLPGIKLFDGIKCKRPSLPKGGPPWMQSLRERILTRPAL